MKNVRKERDFIQQKNIVSVMGYLYDSRGIAPENVSVFLQKMYGTLNENQFSDRLLKNEYICVLYYVSKYGLEADVERQLLESIKNYDENLSELISKKNYLNDFFEVYETAQGFREESKPLIEELVNSGVIKSVAPVKGVSRAEYNVACRKIFNRQIKAVGGAAMFD